MRQWISTFFRLPPAFLRRVVPVALLLFCATLALSLGLWLRRVRTPQMPPAPPDSLLTATFCSVGNGEAAWIKTPHGKFIVIGCGPPGSEAVLLASLRSAKAKQIAVLFLPYPYAEAIGGTGGLVRAFPVGAVYEPTPASDAPVNQWHKAVRAVCREQNVPLQTAWAGQEVTVDGVHIEILAPAKIPLAVSPSGANNSLVLRVRWRKTAFLFAGGLMRAGEDALLSRPTPLGADVLRVARMGNRDATSPELLKQVNPHFIVVSAGIGGSENYPHEETLRRLQATGADVYQTREAVAQNLVFKSDGTRVWGPDDFPSGLLVQ